MGQALPQHASGIQVTAGLIACRDEYRLGCLHEAKGLVMIGLHGEGAKGNFEPIGQDADLLNRRFPIRPKWYRDDPDRWPETEKGCTSECHLVGVEETRWNDVEPSRIHGTERDPRSPGPEGHELWFGVGSTLRKDANASTTTEYSPGDFEGLPVLGQVGVVLSAVDRDRVHGSDQGAEHRHPEEGFFG
jgi:hypothetical protein